MWSNGTEGSRAVFTARKLLTSLNLHVMSGPVPKAQLARQCLPKKLGTICLPGEGKNARFVRTTKFQAVYFGGILLMAYSARAVMVRLGFTPGLAGTTEPSTTYKPG